MDTAEIRRRFVERIDAGATTLGSLAVATGIGSTGLALTALVSWRLCGAPRRRAAVGRRIPLIAGTAVHIVASVLCLVAPNVVVLGLLRTVQGVGAAAAMVVAMAVVGAMADCACRVIAPDA